MENWLSRTEALIGEKSIALLKGKHVAVFGIGGVGSFVVEALVRSGIGKLTLIDHDLIESSNMNRQLIADTSTIGKPKVEVAKERYLRINPALQITTHFCFFNASNCDEILTDSFDYLVDAIDSVTSKLLLIQKAKELEVPILSCMGTGNKLDPSRFEITDIAKTSVCPLAKVMRKELKKKGITKVKVLYSKEEPIKTTIPSPASISFVPSVAGLLIASQVVHDLLKNRENV